MATKNCLKIGFTPQPAVRGALILPAPLSPYPEPDGDPQGRNAAVSTATITVNFNGPKTSGDNILFPINGTCTFGSLDMQSLGGPRACPAPVLAWGWNFEIAATVSDDASNWRIKQGYTGFVRGKWQDSQTNLHAFSSNLNSPNDAPNSFFKQQPKGQNLIFWLDVPGFGYFFDPPTNSEPIDSVSQAQNFTSKVCNKANVCTSVQWFLKLVVDPGAASNPTAALDMSNTQANLRTTSTNF